ncbi:MAG TPA: cyclic nucleotide-binding domain-containing protein [Candidatus Acidoferrales bacterium]|nr:cyclic nucleotide-binding domain-containing protein [Candidatus Acidoferrales bacterium]
MPQATAANTKPTSAKKPTFDLQDFLDTAGVSRKVAEFKKKETIFSQGDPAKNVLYIQKGGVRLSVVNETGKEAVVAVLGPGDFFGEGCLAGQPIRIGTASAITATTALIIEKKEMVRVLHVEHAFSDRFISHMLSRNIRVEEDLVDQLFNSSEKRLARTLLLLARYGTQDKPQMVLPEDLAGDAGGNGRHNSLTREFLHEQVQKTGLHQVQRQASDQHLASERSPARLSPAALDPSCLVVVRMAVAPIPVVSLHGVVLVVVLTIVPVLFRQITPVGAVFMVVPVVVIAVVSIVDSDLHFLRFGLCHDEGWSSNSSSQDY